MSVILYDDQKEALSKMHNGCILCGNMGSGKSITALAYYHTHNGGTLDPFEKMKDPKDLYIITTARKRDTLEWDAELIPYQMSCDPKKNVYSNKIVIDSWNNIMKYDDVKDSFFIFDEQRVVGKGPWVDSFLAISKSNEWILLSATPGDTWMDYIPVFIANGFYKNRSEFIRQHVNYNRFSKYPKVSGYFNEGKLMKLRRMILVGMEFTNHTITHNENVNVSYDLYKYKNVLKDRWDPFKNEPIQNVSGICYILRRIVNSDTSRLSATLDIVAKHKKVIIFYNYDYELEALKELFKSASWPFAEWNGHQHQKLPEGDKWVYLVQYAAGCEGWNCTKTDTMIFYSQNYSYRTMFQASGRINRRNTPFVDLYYYHLSSKSSIDLAISRALKAKKKFNEEKFVSGIGTFTK